MTYKEAMETVDDFSTRILFLTLNWYIVKQWTPQEPKAWEDVWAVLLCSEADVPTHIFTTTEQVRQFNETWS